AVSLGAGQFLDLAVRGSSKEAATGGLAVLDIANVGTVRHQTGDGAASPAQLSGGAQGVLIREPLADLPGGHPRSSPREDLPDHGCMPGVGDELGPAVGSDLAEHAIGSLGQEGLPRSNPAHAFGERPASDAQLLGSLGFGIDTDGEASTEGF